MKYLLIILAPILCVAQDAIKFDEAFAHRGQINTIGLICRLAFDQGSGTNLVDSSGQNVAASFRGSAPTYTNAAPTILANAFSIYCNNSAPSNTVIIPVSSANAVQTVCYWANSASFVTSGLGPNGWDLGYSVSGVCGGGTAVFAGRTGVGTYSYSCTNGTAGWHHYGFVFQSTNLSHVIFYLDGVLLPTTSVGGAPTVTDQTLVEINAQTQYLTASDYDDFRMYNRPLSANEFAGIVLFGQ